MKDMLQNHRPLNKAIVLAGSLGIPTGKAFSVLQKQNIIPDRIVSLVNNPKVRQLVNQSWKRNNSQFSTLLGIPNKVRPVKLPGATYEELLCLTCITDICCSGRMTRKWAKLCNWQPKMRISPYIPIGMQTWLPLPRIEKPVSKKISMSLWQRFGAWFKSWFKNLFGRR